LVTAGVAGGVDFLTGTGLTALLPDGAWPIVFISNYIGFLRLLLTECNQTGADAAVAFDVRREPAGIHNSLIFGGLLVPKMGCHSNHDRMTVTTKKTSQFFAPSRHRQGLSSIWVDRGKVPQ
jgi:hypothetical protein